MLKIHNNHKPVGLDEVIDQNSAAAALTNLILAPMDAYGLYRTQLL